MSDADRPGVRARRPLPTTQRHKSPRVALRVVVALCAVASLVITGLAWAAYHNLTAGLITSHALFGGPTSSNGDQNILIMGLDSRLDEKGNPLPQQMYDALHAGDESNGGYNANVLILLHVPGDGSKATAISIPRDDYVSLSGCPDGQCKGKIKQAYGLAVDQARRTLSAQGVTDPQQLEQQSREAGRKAEIATVRQFLGDVPIDHFVEITLAAFFQIAQVVQPIQVCLNEDTSDSYSGANFHKGLQEIDASQAMAFVRQRRDPNSDLNFTDLDRDRRQQAFIVSLAHKLQSSGTLTDPAQLTSILDVAKQNMAVDSGLDLVSFARKASALTSGNITFFTLPIQRFGQDANGEDVNIVNTAQIHAIVAQLLGVPEGTPTSTRTPTPSPTPPMPTSVAGAEGVVLDVVNGSGRNGLAGELEADLSALGFTQGSASTGSVRAGTAVDYGQGAEQPAQQLAKLLGIDASAAPESAVPAGTVRLTVGTDFVMPPGLGGASGGDTVSGTGGSDSNDPGGTDSSDPSTAPSPVAPVSATGYGDQAPGPTDLTQLGGTGIPCVK
ncbi:LCP family protein [Speluncibacter jeojiensis]|uniref:LCP family protein n=1 Tax=Speluncibacter jeojiensis TaxID=2710754 RepID=A0A9X4LZP3_9ACTN|nr:LCP family protein [Corynebacteriales bacterium D3-21]